MNASIVLFLMVLAGFGTGILYFVVLYRTIDTVMHRKKHVKLILFASFVARATVLITVFFILTRGDWRRVVALVIGFMIARFIMIRRVKRAPLMKEEGAL